jgi:hypothetical protein
MYNFYHVIPNAAVKKMHCILTVYYMQKITHYRIHEKLGQQNVV